MQRRLENLLLVTRWSLLPLYLALLVAVAAIYVMVGRELIHLFAVILTAGETEIVLLVLGLLDLVLVANLLVIVALSSYESSISPLATPGTEGGPDWLGKTGSGDIKVKVSISIVMISMIHLLCAYMQDAGTEQLILLAGVHLVFVASTLALGYASKKKDQ